MKESVYMHSTTERRIELLHILQERKSDTYENLAFEFNVSTRTIARDIEAISKYAPIYTVQGKNGGIRIIEGYKTEKIYLSEIQEDLLKKLISSVDTVVNLTKDDIQAAESILKKFSRKRSV